jgi:hypothetical protein
MSEVGRGRQVAVAARLQEIRGPDQTGKLEFTATFLKLELAANLKCGLNRSSGEPLSVPVPVGQRQILFDFARSLHSTSAPQTGQTVPPDLRPAQPTNDK